MVLFTQLSHRRRLKRSFSVSVCRVKSCVVCMLVCALHGGRYVFICYVPFCGFTGILEVLCKDADFPKRYTR